MSFGSPFCLEGSRLRLLPAEPRGEISWNDKNQPSLLIQTPAPYTPTCTKNGGWASIARSYEYERVPAEKKGSV